MLITLLGIVTLIKPVQPENAKSPMLVTLVGIVTLIRPRQPENAKSPMLVTLLGIIYDPSLPAGYVFKTVRLLLNKTPSTLLNS